MSTKTIAPDTTPLPTPPKPEEKPATLALFSNHYSKVIPDALLAGLITCEAFAVLEELENK